MPKQSSKRSPITKEKILLEAEQLYSVGGYEAINLQIISEALGVTKAALFYHFENKQTLFAELLEFLLLRYNHMIVANFAENKSDKKPPASETKFLNLSLALTEQPMFDVYRYLRSEQHHLSKTQQASLQHACTELLFSPIKQAFKVELEQGELRVQNINIATSLYLSFCNLASLLRNMERGALSTSGLKEMFEVFWYGMSAKKSSSRK
jgi:AcrR family transcriptional regulator